MEPTILVAFPLTQHIKSGLFLLQIYYIANNFLFLNLCGDLPYQLILNINILWEIN